MIEKKCPFCGSAELQMQCRLPNSTGQVTDIYACVVCGVFVPEYNDSIPSVESNKLQVQYHEEYWKSESESDLKFARDEMKKMIEFHRPYLRMSLETNGVVSDVGAGRGNLTAALVDMGFNVVSCEPSRDLHRRALHTYELSEDVLLNVEAKVLLEVLIRKNIEPAAIYLWHVLEHMPDSLEVLKSLNAASNDSTVFFIQMPLLTQRHLYKEHYYLATVDWAFYVEELLDKKLVFLGQSPKSRFMTVIYSNDRSLPEVRVDRSPAGLTQFERSFLQYDSWL